MRHSKFAGLLVVALASALATSAFAPPNGGQFFQPAGMGKVNLVYYGFIKDTEGRLINQSAVLRIDSKALDMDFQFMPDKPGHYRSPDIGAYHKEMGVPVDPKQIEITISLPGYKLVSPMKSTVPNKASGTVNIDFIMQKK